MGEIYANVVAATGIYERLPEVLTAIAVLAVLSIASFLYSRRSRQPKP